MASKASIGGHPIHPMLIPFPIGLLVFSLIGVVGLAIAGYLGGELVFRHGVAVNAQASAPPKAGTSERARAA